MGVIEGREKDNLSRFLSSFPTDLDSTENKLIPGRRIFWSMNSSSSLSSSDNNDDDDVWRIRNKIKSAFCNVFAPSFKGLIQFWAPITRGESLLLSTSDQPFSLEDLNPRVQSYRLFSLDCLVSIDEVSNSAPLADAFMNHFPEVVVDLKRVHKRQRSPLVDKALGCGFTCLILLPVFYKNTSSCLGVVECCMKKLTTDNLRETFDKLNDAIESVGLSTFHAHPQMNVAKHEIQEALKIVCESHHLSIAQVWMPYPIENSSSSFCSQGTTTFVTRLTGYCHPDTFNHYRDDDDGIMIYYDTCDMLPLKMGEGLAGMTLKTHEPLFCYDLSKLTKNFKNKWGLLGRLCCDTDCSCFVISLRLRSSFTGYVDFAFELFWTQTRNHSILMKSVLLTLKMCLPSFEFHSGAQLGDEMRVVDLDRCTTNETASFNLSTSSLNEELQKPPSLVKRKLGALYDSEASQTDSDSDPDGYDDDNDLFFIVDYKGTLNLFILHSSYKLAEAKQIVEKAFKLDPEAYTMVYEVGGGEIKLDTDEKLVSCIKSWIRSPQQMVMFTVCVRCDQQQVAG